MSLSLGGLLCCSEWTEHVIIISVTIVRWPFFQIVTLILQRVRCWAKIFFRQEQSLPHLFCPGKLGRASEYRCHSSTLLKGVWSTPGALWPLLSVSTPRRPLQVRKAPRNRLSTARYLIFSSVAGLNLVQILCHWRQFRKVGPSVLWQQATGKGGCLLSSHKEWGGRRERHGQGPAAFSSPCHWVCQLARTEVPVRHCICEKGGRAFLFFPSG